MRLLIAAGAPGKTGKCVHDYTLTRPRANPQEFGREAPMDSQHMRVHNLRHYVRAAGRGVSFEDHQDLLGHRSTPVTTDCSAAELEKLLHAANRITEFHKSPALTVLRLTG